MTRWGSTKEVRVAVERARAAVLSAASVDEFDALAGEEASAASRYYLAQRRTVADGGFRERAEAKLTELVVDELAAAASDGEDRDRTVTALVATVRALWLRGGFSLERLDGLLAEHAGQPHLRDREYAALRRRFVERRLDDRYDKQAELEDRIAAYCDGAGYSRAELQTFHAWVDREVNSRIPE